MFGSLAAKKSLPGACALLLFNKETPVAISTEQMLDWIARSSVPAITDAVDPDLSELKKSGNKLMIYQGWADPLIIPEPVVNYYEQAAERNGDLDDLKGHARLFMMPGYGHCWERPAQAPDQFDPLEVLEAWVERGEVPTQFVVEQQNEEGEIIRSRPICAYPAVANFQGGDNPDSADSYQCVAPTTIN